MKLSFGHLLTAAVLLAATSVAQAAFIVEAHSSGLGSANFSYGGDTTTASTSVPSTAVGLTGTNSIFGGNGTALPDTYVFSYTPGTNADNYAVAAGTILGDKSGNVGNGNIATGLIGGVSGTYRLYFTTPETTGISGGGTDFTLTQDGSPIAVDDVDLNNGGTGADTNPATGFTGGANNAWHLLGTVDLVAGNTYSLTQRAGSNTFVSTRSHGVMWELVTPVPEPTTAGMLLIGGAALALRRRRQA